MSGNDEGKDGEIDSLSQDEWMHYELIEEVWIEG